MKKFTRIEPTVIQTVGDLFEQQVVIKHFRTEDGLEHEFTTIYSEDSKGAAVIALTPDNKVLTVLQFRAGPEAWMYELPGGSVELGEDVEVAVLRELKEETGYTVGSIEYLGENPGDGYKNTRCYYYLATHCTPAGDGKSLDDEEAKQGVEVQLLTIDELIENAKFGRMTDSLAVLMAYEKLKELGALYETGN